MKVLNNLLKKNRRHELVLVIIFFIYLLFDMKTPNVLIGLINNVVGLVVIVLLVIYLLINSNPILGILSVLVAYELLRRSEVDTTAMLQPEKRQPSEKKKNQYYTKFNKIPVTLEEELVRKLSTQVRTSRVLEGKPVKTKLETSSDKFKPVLDRSVIKAGDVN